MPGRSSPLPLDQKFSQFVAPHFPIDYDQDLFGIEIELEGSHVQSDIHSIHSLWKQTKDGSLRGRPDAIEYLSRQPLNKADTKKSLELLLAYLTTTPGVKVIPSYRTSIHVHVNCMNEKIRVVANYITLAMIFDELFVSQNGQARVGNNFCLRTRDAEGQVTDLIHSINSFGTLHNVNNQHRYSSTNICSLGKYGTIEFRSLECTTDFDRIWHWIMTLQTLKEAARKYEDPREIIGKFSSKGALGFVMYNLGEYGHKYVGVSEYENMLHKGMRLAQDFAFCSEWKAGEVKAQKPKPKKKYQDYEPPEWGINNLVGGGNHWGVAVPAGAEAYIAQANNQVPAEPVYLTIAPHMLQSVLDAGLNPYNWCAQNHYSMPLGYGQNAPQPIAAGAAPDWFGDAEPVEDEPMMDEDDDEDEDFEP